MTNLIKRKKAERRFQLYGIFAVLLAVLVGWGSNLVFRKV